MRVGRRGRAGGTLKFLNGPSTFHLDTKAALRRVLCV
jgi:hypothetical protein